MLMATLQRILNERNQDLLATLVDRADFSRSQARTFLPPALAMIAERVEADPSWLGRTPEQTDLATLEREIDFLTVCHEAGVSEPFARGGIRALLPAVLRLLRAETRAPGHVRETLPKDRREAAHATKRGFPDETPINP